MARENFPKSVRETLAGRVGHRCSYPGCARPTVGPRSDGGVVKTEVGCHIYPASGNGPRAELPFPSTWNRRGYENGVMMCSEHGQLIDKDDGRFTPDTLVKYRNRAERIHEKNYYGAQVASREVALIPVKLALTATVRSQDIDGEQRLPADWRGRLIETLEDGAVMADWGVQAGHDLYQALAETIKNSVEHGDPRKFVMSVAITDNTVDLHVEHESFTFEDYATAEPTNNGALTLTDFIVRNRHVLSAHTERSSTGMHYRFATTKGASPSDPCSAPLEHGTNWQIRLDALKNCSTTYLHIADYWIRSDEYILIDSAKTVLERGDAVVIYVRGEQRYFVEASLHRAFGALPAGLVVTELPKGGING